MQEINIRMSMEQYSNTMMLLHNWIQIADSLKGKFPEGNELRGIFENLESSLTSIQSALNYSAK